MATEIHAVPVEVLYEIARPVGAVCQCSYRLTNHTPR